MKTGIIAIGALALLWAGVATIGIEKSETASCLRLERQSESFAPHFYLTHYEKEMCDARGITINAPVK